MSWLAAQRELVARYRAAIAAYWALPQPLRLDVRRYCDHFVDALGPITWDDSGTSFALDPDAAYREAMRGDV